MTKIAIIGSPNLNKFNWRDIHQKNLYHVNMHASKKSYLFQLTAIAIFCLFMGLMIFVTITAFSRRSSYTGMDMGKVQQMRQVAVQKSA